MSSWFRCVSCGQGIPKDQGAIPPDCPRCGAKLTSQTDFLTLPPELDEQQA